MNQREREYMHRVYRLTSSLRGARPANPADIKMWVLKGHRTAKIMDSLSLVFADLMYGDYEADMVEDELDDAERAWNEDPSTGETQRLDYP